MVIPVLIAACVCLSVTVAWLLLRPRLQYADVWLAYFDGVWKSNNSLDDFQECQLPFTKLSYEASMAFKAKFGEMAYNKANRMLAGEFARGWLKDNNPDMRNCDIVLHSEYAVELALTPTPVSVEMARLSRASQLRQRRCEVHQNR